MKSNNNNQLLDFLRQNYSQIGIITKIKKIESSNINSENYLITTSKSKFVLRKFTDNSPSKKIEKMCQILVFCKQKKAKVMEPFKNKNNLFVNTKNQMYLTKFYDGEFFDKSLNEIKTTARNLGLLHKTLSTNKISYDFQTNQKFYKILVQSELIRIEKMIQKKQKKDSVDSQVSKNISLLKSNSKFLKKNKNIVIRSKISKQLIHFDLHPKNILFNKGRVLAFLDFASMRKGYKITDVVFTGFRFAIEKTLDPKKINQLINFFITNYLSKNQLSETEMKHLDYFLTNEIFSRICFIIRKKYFYDSSFWQNDLSKFLEYLKIINKIKLDKSKVKILKK